MVCRQFEAKPSPEEMLTYSTGTSGKKSMQFKSKYKTFHSPKSIDFSSAIPETSINEDDFVQDSVWLLIRVGIKS